MRSGKYAIMAGGFFMLALISMLTIPHDVRSVETHVIEMHIDYSHMIPFDFSQNDESLDSYDIKLLRQLNDPERFYQTFIDETVTKAIVLYNNPVGDASLSDCEDGGLYTSTHSGHTPAGLEHTICVLTREGDVVKIGPIEKTSTLIRFQWSYLEGGQNGNGQNGGTPPTPGQRTVDATWTCSDNNGFDSAPDPSKYCYTEGCLNGENVLSVWELSRPNNKPSYDFTFSLPVSGIYSCTITALTTEFGNSQGAPEQKREYVDVALNGENVGTTKDDWCLPDPGGGGDDDDDDGPVGSCPAKTISTVTGVTANPPTSGFPQKFTDTPLVKGKVTVDVSGTPNKNKGAIFVLQKGDYPMGTRGYVTVRYSEYNGQDKVKVKGGIGYKNDGGTPYSCGFESGRINYAEGEWVFEWNRNTVKVTGPGGDSLTETIDCNTEDTLAFDKIGDIAYGYHGKAGTTMNSITIEPYPGESGHKGTNDPPTCKGWDISNDPPTQC